MTEAAGAWISLARSFRSMARKMRAARGAVARTSTGALRSRRVDREVGAWDRAAAEHDPARVALGRSAGVRVPGAAVEAGDVQGRDSPAAEGRAEAPGCQGEGAARAAWV